MYRAVSLPAIAAVIPLAALLAVCAPRPSIPSGDAPEPETAPVEATAATAPVATPSPARDRAIEEAPPPVARVVASPRVRALPTTAERARGTAELRRAVQYRTAGDWRAAAEGFRSAAGMLPLLDDWSHLLAAEMAGRAGDTTAVRRVLEAADPLRAREWGWRAAQSAFLAARDSAAAIRLLQESGEVVTDAGRRAEIFRRLGDLQLRRGNAAAAVAAYRRAMEIAPASPAARESAAAMTSLDRSPPDRLLPAPDPIA
jgi:tetratricopeptide (TPR) repeat protein